MAMRQLIVSLALLGFASSAFATMPALIVDGDDGKVALQLRAVKIRVTVRGHLARTEYELTYHSSLDRITGGDFYFPLPADAEVSDLGLWFEGRLRHGVAVERVLARTAYEEVVHRRADPALAEWTAGRGFHLSVYPIPANGDKEVLIAYDQELTGGDYLLDVRERASIPSFDVAVDSDGAPAREEGGMIRVARERNETAFTAREVAPASHVVILYDTSASSVRQNRALLRRFLTEFLSRQQAWSTAVVLPFHIDVDEPRAIESAGTPAGGRALERILDDLQPLGATNLAAVASRLSTLATELPPSARIVLVTDGLTSLGNSRDVAAAVARLAGVHRPILAVQAAPNADDRLLANAARATGGWSIDLNRVDPDVAVETAMHQPLAARLSGSEVVPEMLLASSDARFTVAARGKEPFTTLPLSINATAREVPVRELRGEVEANMVRRAWARAKLRELLTHGAPDDDLIAHGLAFNQLTPRTSLLVLEAWQDYERYGIPMPPDVIAQKAREEEEQRAQAAAWRNLPNPVPPPVVTPGGWSLHGRILMEEGTPLPGVTVILKDGDSVLCGVVTDADGRFIVAASVPPKDPRVFAQLEGFGSAMRDLAAGTPSGSTLEISMHMAAVQESITVTAAAPVILASPAVAATVRQSLRDDRAVTTDALLSRIATESGSEESDDPEVQAAVARQRRELRQRVIDRLRAIGSTAERIRYYLSARALLGGDKGFHVFAAEVFRERSPEVAVRVLSDLAEARPDDAPLLRILARVVDGWGAEPLARLLLERAIEVSPTEPQSWREMILLEARHGHARAVASWSKRLAAGKRRDWMEAVYEQTSEALGRWEKASLLDRQRGVELRSAAGDDLTIELMFDTGWSWVDLHVTEASGERVSWDQPQSRTGATFTGGYTFGFGPEIYTLPKAPRGEYRLAIDYYAADQTNVSLETLVHVIIRARGRRGVVEQSERFVVLSEQKENLLLTTVTME